MRKVLLYSALLVLGLVGSQILPGLVGPAYDSFRHGITWLTMVALSFIMIHVGYEFDLDKSNLRSYGWDYVVAATAAAFPWVFCALYFVLIMRPMDHWDSLPVWKESLLASRFASPTSAGVLFAMLAVAGLSATWMFRKARVLAIFDDLDTILLMIPLKMMMVGPRWQLGVVVLFMAVLLWLAWRYLHAVSLSIRWPWVLTYSVVLAAVSESVHMGSMAIDDTVPVHLEVLLPAFVLGCVIRRPPGHDPHVDDAREGHEQGPEDAAEQRVSSIVSATFMVLVGLSMPQVSGAPAEGASLVDKLGAPHAPWPGWGMIAVHVVLITLVSNVGKMFPALCYRKETTWQERLALAVAMFPRGEVGAGVLVVSLSYGIGGPALTVAMLSLALNLVCTGLFILIVKRLLAASARQSSLQSQP